MKAIELSQFRFMRSGHGSYMVEYDTPTRGDFWVAYIDDMTLIDATKNADDPKRKDLENLRKKVVATGTHYNKYMQRIE